MKYKISSMLLAWKAHRWQDGFFLVAAGAAMGASALHFWPLDDSRIWRMFNVPNLCCVMALVVAAVLWMTAKGRRSAAAFCPPVCIVAYLTIHILSIAFADSLSRPLNYTAKLGLVLVGGLFLFQRALTNRRTLHGFYRLAAAAVSLSILACIYTRLTVDPQRFGFYESAFKYGTYMAILAPLAGVYLLGGSQAQIGWAILMIAGAVFSAGTMGPVCSILAGLVVALIMAPGRHGRRKAGLAMLFSLAAAVLSHQVFDGAVYRDAALRENDGVHLRQRYIEWQAEINLLAKRGIIGTGAGCVNDYRSNFYYRLPKLNTLEAFDQNGLLAVGAETGLLGLVTFVWIVVHYGRMSFGDLLLLRANKEPQAAAMATANTAGLVSAVTANLFSSVHYNGVLIVFVLLLALISSTRRICGENSGADQNEPLGRRPHYLSDRV